MSLKKQKKSNWFIEDLHRNYKLMLLISSLLYEGRTKYQEIKIFENELLFSTLEPTTPINEISLTASTASI